ncbi:FAD:protein FMN transferase [bacterium]|nr:MAG: FAD:protein FMN transferase [bacterium]
MWWKRPGRDFAKVAHFEGVLGTALEFQASGESEAIVDAAERAALAEIDRLEPIFNRYRTDSELSRWEETGGDVSPEFAEVLASAEAWRVCTGGAFHPAVEALTRLWKEGTPDPERLRRTVEALAQPLWTIEKGKVTRHTALPANLNAIAKGYIIDRACEAAARIDGVDTVLVNIGGDMRHWGRKPLTVDIVDPFRPADNETPIAGVRLSGVGMATSGAYHRGRHLFDPRTGQPIERIVSASVIAPDALTADVLATAFTVLLPCESLELADATPGVALFLVDADGRRFANSLWPRFSILPDA